MSRPERRLFAAARLVDIVLKGAIDPSELEKAMLGKVSKALVRVSVESFGAPLDRVRLDGPTRRKIVGVGELIDKRLGFGNVIDHALFLHAMVLVVNDVYEQLPDNRAGRKAAWGALYDALLDLLRVVDPEIAKRVDEGFEVGEQIKAAIWRDL